ncbi:hypothetical protein NGM37_01910, partial [Streptomyces sp. TRM76130]|nr:hypothetical protein [Streptomyces sp. TRM76130]
MPPARCCHGVRKGTAGSLTVAAVGIALLLFLIITAGLQPFVALLAVFPAVGLPAGLSVTELFGTVQRSDAGSTVESGMGGIPGHVAVSIGAGTMRGAILDVSGGAQGRPGRPVLRHRRTGHAEV